MACLQCEEREREDELAGWMAKPKGLPEGAGQRAYVYEPVSSEVRAGGACCLGRGLLAARLRGLIYAGLGQAASRRCRPVKRPHVPRCHAQEVQRYERLLSELQPQHAQQVRQLWEQLRQARQACELMTCRGVRVCSDVAIGWSGVTLGLAEKAQRQEQQVRPWRRQRVQGVRIVHTGAPACTCACSIPWPPQVKELLTHAQQQQATIEQLHRALAGSTHTAVPSGRACRLVGLGRWGAAGGCTDRPTCLDGNGLLTAPGLCRCRSQGPAGQKQQHRHAPPVQRGCGRGRGQGRRAEGRQCAAGVRQR